MLSVMVVTVMGSILLHGLVAPLILRRRGTARGDVAVPGAALGD